MPDPQHPLCKGISCNRGVPRVHLWYTCGGRCVTKENNVLICCMCHMITMKGIIYGPHSKHVGTTDLLVS